MYFLIMKRIVVHIDMDAFFASVEQLDNPELRGKPVVVGGNPFVSRTVVSSASYEAREYGIHSAMPMRRAFKLCPSAIFVRPRFRRYEQIAQQIFSILTNYSPLVELASIDEAYIDLTGTEKLFGEPTKTAMEIKLRIRDEIGLTASVGVAPNKFLAKMASEVGKPDGFIVITPDKVREFLDPMPIEALWGIGPKSAEHIRKLGVHKVADLLPFDSETLKSMFGKAGQILYNLVRGIDEMPVEPYSPRKSISIERTFSQDLSRWETIRKALLALADKLAERMMHEKIVGRTITVRIRYHDFSTITRSKTSETPTCSPRKIYSEATKLVNPEVKGRKIRLLGIGMSNLSKASHKILSLFDSEYERDEKLLQAILKIKDKFGSDKIFRASYKEKPSRKFHKK